MNSIFGCPEVGRQALPSMLISLLVLALPACHAQPSKLDTTGTSAAVDRPPVKAPIGTRIELTLAGYNYTNRYIDQFDVDGQGGGNLFVSEGLNGGGKSTCCVSYRTGAGAWKAKIRWQSGACTYNQRISGGQKFSDIYSFFKEIEVQVNPDIPDFPHYFEVHIYPDGHAEAAITEHESRARLVLSKEREDNSAFPRCPNDKKPNQ